MYFPKKFYVDSFLPELTKKSVFYALSSKRCRSKMTYALLNRPLVGG